MVVPTYRYGRAKHHRSSHTGILRHDAVLSKFCREITNPNRIRFVHPSPRGTPSARLAVARRNDEHTNNNRHHLPKDLGPFVAWLLSFILSLSLSHTHIKNHVSSIACGSPTDDHGRDAVTGGRRVRRYVPYIGRCLDQPTAS